MNVMPLLALSLFFALLLAAVFHPQRGLRLTPEGKRWALQVVRAHRGQPDVVRTAA